MIITIDCRLISSSGIGVTIRGCLPLLLDSDNYFYLLGDPEKLEKIVLNHKNCEILKCCIRPFSPQETCFFPKSILRKINSGDLFYSLYLNIPGGIKVPVYTTIHDIIFPDMPKLITRLGLAARMYFYRRCFRYSKKIFTVSEFSKSRIEYYSKGKKPVIVTYNAVQPFLLQYREKTAKIEKKELILFIGNIKKHKGLDCLLEAFQSAKADGLHHQLVIIGSRDNFRTLDNSFLRRVDSFGSDAVKFTGYISDEELAEYLSSASLLVQPSLYEGFGLPPLEAMTLGTQALISDIQVFKEIYKDFPVVFFRAGDIEDLKNKMMEILCGKKPPSLVLSDELLGKYTFEKTAGIILRELQ